MPPDADERADLRGAERHRWRDGASPAVVLGFVAVDRAAVLVDRRADHRVRNRARLHHLGGLRAVVRGSLPPENSTRMRGTRLLDQVPNGEEICLDSTSEHWVNNFGEAGIVDEVRRRGDGFGVRAAPRAAVCGGHGGSGEPGRVPAATGVLRLWQGRDGAVDHDGRGRGNPGDFPLLGDECAGTAPESNPDFAKAATASTMITEASKDISCAVEGDPSSCRLFEGSVEKCRDLQGSWLGLPDCCRHTQPANRPAASAASVEADPYELAQKPVVAGPYLSQSSVGTAINSAIGPGGCRWRRRPARSVGDLERV